MSVIYRSVQSSDLPLIKKLDKDTFNDSVQIDYSKMKIQVACDTQVIGYISYQYKTIDGKKYIYISTLLVSKAHQNKGIGSKLLSNLIKNTYTPLILYVDKNANHDKLVKYYKSFGFKLFGKSPSGNTRMLLN